MQRKYHLFLILPVLFALALAGLSFWIVRNNSLRATQGFMISNVFVGVDMTEQRHSIAGFLTGNVFSFPYGSPQVCVQFDYNHLRSGAAIDIMWDWDGKLVQVGSYTPPAPSGTRMYCLLHEDGSPLPKGSYSITIKSRSEIMPKFYFEITDAE